MTFNEYLGKWSEVINKRVLDIILNKLELEYKTKLICPMQRDVFKAFKLCSYDELKVVMVGQDPYPQKGVATGILFGNKKETRNENLSPSLQVIRKTIIDLENSDNCITFDPTLENWAKQGILMLNSALTVEMNKVGSHTMLWRPFISDLLQKLSNSRTGIIYVLFGRQAQTFKPYINKQFNTVLEERHPAYFARTGEKMPDTIFKEVNELIRNKYKIPIIWY